MQVRRTAFAVLAAVAAVGGSTLVADAAYAASPGQASVSGNGVVFTAGKGARNDVVLTYSTRSVVIQDRVAITAGKGCIRVGGSSLKVKCTTPGNPAWSVVSLGDQDDRIVSNLGGYNDISGGAGNDVITGGYGRDDLWGDAGNDVITGGSGADTLGGGAGNDVLRGGWGDDHLYADPGADTYQGNQDYDVIDYRMRTKPLIVDLDGAQRDDGERGEHDTVGGDIEGLIGGSGADRLIGNGFDNKIVGGPGNDVILGGGSNDILVGGKGDDKLYGGGEADYLVGEFMKSPRPQPDGSTGKDNPAARDLLDGGTNPSPVGDICVGVRAARLLNCESTG